MKLIAAASIALLAAGCQSSSRPSAALPENAPPHTFSREGSSHQQWAGSDDGVYYDPQYRDEDEPVNPAVRALGAAGSGIVNFFSAIIDVPVSGFKWLGGERPSDAARMVQDAGSADNRRQGINKLLEYDFTRRDPYTTLYRQMAQQDTDPTVRAAAIRAANRARDSKATRIFVSGLNDSNEWVRLEAAKALVNLPDAAAIPSLLTLLHDADQSRDVRIATADALKHYRTLTVARALVAVLNDHDFGVGWQARHSLKYLFSRDLGYSDSAWLAFLSGPASPVK